MSVNGYSDKLIAIDDEMLALGRPLPPVVSWLSAGRKGDFNAQTAAWQAEVERWEEAHWQVEGAGDTRPCVCGKAESCAVKWHELRQKYIQQERLELKLRYDEDAWNYELLSQLGVPSTNLDVIRRKFDDNASMRAARDWTLETAWCLVLIGGTGCGKSSAAAWVAHQRLMRNHAVQWVDCVKQCERPMYGIAAEHRRWQCRTVDTLVLDDLGSGRRERETKPGEANHLWLAWLDDVIGSRANDGKRTIITTNRSVDELRAWLGERIVDRLRTGMVISTSEKSLRRSAA